MKGFALGLTLKQRRKATGKSPICGALYFIHSMRQGEGGGVGLGGGGGGGYFPGEFRNTEATLAKPNFLRILHLICFTGCRITSPDNPKEGSVVILGTL